MAAMIKGRITLRLLSVITVAFVVAAAVAVLLSNYQTKKIIDKSQTLIYAEKLDSILRTLKRKYDRLQLTGMVDAYEQDFKESALRALRQIHYKTADQPIYPFISGPGGEIVMHPEYPYGDKSLADTEYIKKALRLKTGNFDYIYKNSGEKWTIFKHFREWDWVVGYAIPIDVKYADAGKLRNNLLLTMTVITLLTLLILSVIITKLTKPITDLTNISSDIAAGNLEKEINVRGKDEIGILADSFDRMRVSVKKMISDLEDKNKELNEEIIERKRFEESLKKSEELFSKAFHSSPDAVLISTLETGRIVDVNEGFENISGYSKKEAVGKTASEINLWLNPEDRNKFRDILQKEGKVFKQEVDFKVKLGEIRACLISIELINIHGEMHMITVAHDITERKKADEMLKESEEKFSKAFHSSPNLMGIFDLDKKRRIDINESGVRITGYSREEIIDTTIDEFDFFIDKEKVEKGIHLVETEGSFSNMELRIRTKTGQTRVLLYSGVGIEVKGKRLLLVTGEDITERKALEKQLVQAQKMESIGTLAGGIAHDFNNILNAILGFTYLVKIKLPENSEAIDSLDRIKNAANRATDLVRQILTFSRIDTEGLKPITITHIVKEVLKLLRASIPSSIEINQNIAPTKSVLTDPVHIHQILMNLCTNAYHAMQDTGGIIEVDLQEVDIDSEFASQQIDMKPGPHVRLSVSDTGYGIDPSIISRIFEPYFTTKGPGKGTGLGLSVIHGIVKNSGGTITVFSELSKGTIFNVYLPVIDKEDQLEVKAAVSLIKGFGTVMIVDDEQSMIIIVREVLESLGYKVIGCTDSLEALELFREKPEKYDLILTDLTMPKMTGLSLAKEILSIRSDIPIILATGYAEGIDQEMINKSGIRALLLKPFSADKLSQTVYNALHNYEHKES